MNTVFASSVAAMAAAVLIGIGSVWARTSRWYPGDSVDGATLATEGGLRWTAWIVMLTLAALALTIAALMARTARAAPQMLASAGGCFGIVSLWSLLRLTGLLREAQAARDHLVMPGAGMPLILFAATLGCAAMTVAWRSASIVLAKPVRDRLEDASR